jgi:hypothetical protein
MLETLDASGLVAHAIGPGDRFYITLREGEIDTAGPVSRPSTPPIIRDNPSAPQANGKLENPQRLISSVAGMHDRGTQPDFGGIRSGSAVRRLLVS